MTNRPRRYEGLGDPLGVQIYVASELCARSMEPAELVAECPLVVRLGQRVIFYGAPGALKTMVALDTAVRAVLHHRRAVMFITAEGTVDAIAQRIDALVRGLGSSGIAALGDGLVLVHGGFDILDAHADDVLETLTRDIEPSLVIVDPAVSFCGDRDENHASEVMPVLNQIGAWAQAGIAVILLHHASKASKDLRGSSAFRGWADMIYSFERGDAQVSAVHVSCEKARDEEPPPPCVLRVEFAEVGTTVTLDTAPRELPTRGSANVQQRMLRALSDAPQTKTELANAVRCSSGKATEVLDGLRGQGLARALPVPCVDDKGRRREQVGWVRSTPTASPGGRTDAP